MNQQMGLTDFFAMEAGEYLERLDAEVSGRGAPNAREFVRLARALRGSALMAKQQLIAAAATALEHLARGIHDERLAWDEGVKLLAVRSVDDLKVLVRSVREWLPDHDEKARRMIAELERVTGRRSGEVTAPTPAITEPLDTGTRAFIGREGAAVGSALDQAAKALQQNPLAHDPLHRVLKVMQPLRGLAILTELPPLPDVLEGVERAIAAVTRHADPVPAAALLFHAAAKAVTQAAQGIAAAGRADPDTAEAQEFARRLGDLTGLAGGEDVVPIESLYFDDAGPHVVAKGTVAGRGGQLSRLELVSHGEHLQKAADELARATSVTQRELRAQALAGTFRALAAATGGPLQNAVSAFASAAREAVALGGATHQTAAFATQIREAGTILTRAGQEDATSAAARLTRMLDALRALTRGAPAPAPTAAAPAGGPPSRPRAAAAAVAAPHPAAPMTGAGAAPGSEESPNLIGSWQRYQRYVEHLGWGEPSLEELLSGPPADPARAASPAAPTTPGGVAAGQVVVDITDLLYRGRAALERAQLLRGEIRRALAGSGGAAVQDLIEEVFDLVELGLKDA